jgi:hypothetical protein
LEEAEVKPDPSPPTLMDIVTQVLIVKAMSIARLEGTVVKRIKAASNSSTAEVWVLTKRKVRGADGTQ